MRTSIVSLLQLVVLVSACSNAGNPPSSPKADESKGTGDAGTADGGSKPDAGATSRDAGDGEASGSGGSGGGGAGGSGDAGGSGGTGGTGGTGSATADGCDLDTDWLGDENCVLPPPSEEGFQIHFGPSDYATPESSYVLQPGQEQTETWILTTPNTATKYIYFRQYRMRPGMHHLIVNAGPSSRIGFSTVPVKDMPEGGVIAPENEGVGIRIDAETRLSVYLQTFNFTDRAMLKEAWVNFWYRDQAHVTEEPSLFLATAPIGIEPDEHVLVGCTCQVNGNGRLLSLAGLSSSHNRRFSAYRVRGALRDRIFEAYDWTKPGMFDFSSTTSNPQPVPANKTPGGWTGVLELREVDVIEFECEIDNDTDHSFMGSVKVLDDEVCMLIGESVGATVSNACPCMKTPL